ncbi:MAG: NADH-quinone oxidoreductase subunit NuoF [Oscillospiraceae bacterium]|nr:NADH-quinone oxidoreductase subunit NuoF [Oscillospiraceae bacterium]
MKILVGQGSCGLAAGAGKVFAALESEITRQSLVADLAVCGCVGTCALEPMVEIFGSQQNQRFTLVKVDEKDARDIIKALKSGVTTALERLSASEEDCNVLEAQTRIVLENCGRINPEDIAESGGYRALRKALSQTPERIIKEIKRSGLAGRGGAGFPTWFKWNAARQAPGKNGKKYMICNADEGDPGAFMDRAVLEGDPHRLIEGMLIAAYAIGAETAVVYVRAEYPLAIKRLTLAIDQAEKAGFLGENILDSAFSCAMTIKAGAGAFVCGEETALIESLEGNRGMPRLKPPFPAARGYWNQPTNINNVETLANVPWIILNGGEAFAKMGTENSKGTKVFALTGKINRGGLVETPMGLTLADIIYKIGGGVREGGKLKAVQMGGPSGGCIPASLLGTRVDYKELSATGAIMGSGGMVIMDESVCMVEMARFFLEFTAGESCGKCVHCRIGTTRLLEMLTDIIEGHGKPGDIERLESLCLQIKEGALCGLGQTAPNPVISTLRYFRREYEEHINGGKCAAKSCKALLHYTVDETKCRGCTLCAKKCPSDAISGAVKSAHKIDKEKCVKCGACKDVCRFDAILVD